MHIPSLMPDAASEFAIFAYHAFSALGLHHRQGLYCHRHPLSSILGSGPLSLQILLLPTINKIVLPAHTPGPSANVASHTCFQQQEQIAPKVRTLTAVKWCKHEDSQESISLYDSSIVSPTESRLKSHNSQIRWTKQQNDLEFTSPIPHRSIGYCDYLVTNP